MRLNSQFELLASYNQWMNENVYKAAGQLDAAELSRDRGAFFGSILGTLNHILVADRIWLKRFAVLPSGHDLLRDVADLPDPTGLDQILFDDFPTLDEHRAWLDGIIVTWIAALSESDLDSVLSYRNRKGISANKGFSSLILHFFNHQTHHRGQVTTLLTQADVDVGVTDLLVRIPEAPSV